MTLVHVAQVYFVCCKPYVHIKSKSSCSMTTSNLIFLCLMRRKEWAMPMTYGALRWSVAPLTTPSRL